MSEVKIVDIRMVAREASCSITTVSMALNGTGRISEKTRKHVQEVARRLGYVPNASGKNLKRRKSESIGIIYPSFSHLFINTFYASVMDGVEEVLNREHHNMVIAGYKEEQGNDQLAKFIRERSVDGVLFVSQLPGEMINATRELMLPIVLVDDQREGLDVDYVLSDNRGGAFKATQHLIEKGHRRIAIFKSSEGIRNFEMRLEGYRDALVQHGIAFDPALVIDEVLENGANIATELQIAKGFDFTAAFAVNDDTAVAVMRAFRAHGYAVPGDVSLIGYDDTAFGQFMGLTTVAVNKKMLGQTGAELLFRRMKDPDATYERVVQNVELIERDSVRALF